MVTVNKTLLGAVLALLLGVGVLGTLYTRQVRSNAELTETIRTRDVTIKALQESAKARAKADEVFNKAQTKEATRQKEEAKNVERTLEQNRSWSDSPVPAGVCAVLGLCRDSAAAPERTPEGDAGPEAGH